MCHFPNEILLLIYKYANSNTRINMNKALGWSYRAANPFMDKQIVPMYPIHPKFIPKKLTMFNYVMRGH